MFRPYTQMLDYRANQHIFLGHKGTSFGYAKAFNTNVRLGCRCLLRINALSCQSEVSIQQQNIFIMKKCHKMKEYVTIELLKLQIAICSKKLWCLTLAYIVFFIFLILIFRSTLQGDRRDILTSFKHDSFLWQRENYIGKKFYLAKCDILKVSYDNLTIILKQRGALTSTSKLKEPSSLL